MSIEAPIGQKFGLGPIDQISFAVANVEEAVPRYTAMFGGPFAVLDVPDMDFLYYEKPATVTLRLAFGRSGDLEVELVEVVTGRYPISEWFESHGEGLHHVRYPVSDCDASRKEMEAAGFRTTIRGGAGTINFAYLESPLLNGMTIELIEGQQSPS